MLTLSAVSISFLNKKTTQTVVSDISFSVKKNEIVGLVGESGSGKSVTSLAVLGLLPKAITKITGRIDFNGTDLLSCTEKSFQRIRGKKIAMIFQEPMSSLNPTLSCGSQVAEVLQQHTTCTKQEIKETVLSLFEKVKLPSPAQIFTAYPHEISGGQQQRVMIAMAIACQPALLIADEPTTALDVTVQKEIIQLLKSLQQETGMGILFISHDLALVSEIADRVVVMHQGKQVEEGPVAQVFKHSKAPYTKALIASKPTLKERLKILPTVADFMAETAVTEIYTAEERAIFHEKIYQQKPLLEIVDLKKEFVRKTAWFSTADTVKAIDGVSFKVFEGETLGLVGESGCGKSTLGRTILQLEKASSGYVFYKGNDITTLSKKAIRSLRKEIQLIFQDPFSSLNPRITIGEAILEPMSVHKILANNTARKTHVITLLEEVGLLPEHYNRYPHEFSGGQRQRIGIARAIALQPKLIICDESVSALDVSVQAQVLNLLNRLKENYKFTYIFISHDLSVVKYMADQLVVMNQGKIEEIGDADAIYKAPKSTYTKALIAAIPKGI